MSDWPVPGGDFRGVSITSYDCVLSIGSHLGACVGNSAGATVAWGTANRAIFVPFICPVLMIVKKMFWCNGATVAGNTDVGVYDTGGHRIASKGTTVQAGATAIQIVDNTDFTLLPGRYYMALSSSSTTATYQRAVQPGAAMLGAMGCLQMASAFALPDPATFAAFTFTAVPMFGLSAITAI